MRSYRTRSSTLLLLAVTGAAGVATSSLPAGATAPRQEGARTPVATSQQADTNALTPHVPTDSLPAPDGPTGASEELEAETRRVASSLRCPVCLNLSIEDSPSRLARDMKDMIRRRLERGETPAEIRQYFVDRYGEWVLVSPEPEGVNLLLWMLPAAGLLGGIVVVTAVVRRWIGRNEETASPQPE